jgi:hypothetical protein
MRQELPTFAAGGTAAVTVALLSAFTNTTGTLIGTGLSATLFGAVSTTYKHGIEKAEARAKKIRAAHLHGVIRDPDVYDELFGLKNVPHKRDIPWKRIAVAAGMIMVLCFGVATTVEALANKPLAVTGGTVAPPPASPIFSPTPTPTQGSPSSSGSSSSPSSFSSPSSSSATTPSPNPSPTPDPTFSSGGSP